MVDWDRVEEVAGRFFGGFERGFFDLEGVDMVLRLVLATRLCLVVVGDGDEMEECGMSFFNFCAEGAFPSSCLCWRLIRNFFE